MNHAGKRADGSPDGGIGHPVTSLTQRLRCFTSVFCSAVVSLRSSRPSSAEAWLSPTPPTSLCGVRRKCLKWFTVQKFPQVLVLHLKRFSPTERFRGKLNVLVEFPLSNLDMSPYAATRGPAPVYNLYAVSNHSGTTYSGHYTAYCKHPYTGDWHEYNDSRVSPINSRNVVSSEAYVLFYELARHT
uniref:ubiquitinyl hydrolase 1 n=1 Tax=Spodoptera frugiperda TaxID=7108 RepID=A0A2H1VKY6_SPOFR